MATWKKIITSGSAADLASLTLDTTLAVAEGGTGATSLTDKAVLISQDSGTDAIGSLALATNGHIIVGGTSGPAAEAGADVAGTGLDAAVGDGTLAINVAAAQTSVTSIINSSLGKIGTAAAQEYVKFDTANEVNIHINDAERLSVTATGVDISGSAIASVSMSAAHITAPIISASFYGDGSNLAGVGADIDSLSALGGTGLHQTQDHFMFSDNGTEKKITFSNLEDAIFGNVSGNATIAAGGALSLAADSVDSAEIADDAIDSEHYTDASIDTAHIADDQVTYAKIQNVSATNRILGRDSSGAGVIEEISPANVFAMFSGDLGGNFTIGNQSSDTATFTGGVAVGGGMTVTGDLTVNGTTTMVSSSNLKIQDKFMFLASGSGAGTDGGFIVQSGSAANSGSAMYHDISSQRWAVAKSIGQSDVSIVPTNFIATISASESNPTNNNDHDQNYGAGEMVVNTDSGEIWIRA